MVSNRPLPLLPLDNPQPRRCDLAPLWQLQLALVLGFASLPLPAELVAGEVPGSEVAVLNDLYVPGSDQGFGPTLVVALDRVPQIGLNFSGSGLELKLSVSSNLPIQEDPQEVFAPLFFPGLERGDVTGTSLRTWVVPFVDLGPLSFG